MSVECIECNLLTSQSMWILCVCMLCLNILSSHRLHDIATAATVTSDAIGVDLCVTITGTAAFSFNIELSNFLFKNNPVVLVFSISTLELNNFMCIYLVHQRTRNLLYMNNSQICMFFHAQKFMYIYICSSSDVLMHLFYVFSSGDFYSHEKIWNRHVTICKTQLCKYTHTYIIFYYTSTIPSQWNIFVLW